MILQDLINIEEKLLQYECDNKFNMSFNEYIELNEYLNKIGKITTQYFLLIEQYDKELLKSGLTEVEYKNLLTEYNIKLLNENIILDINIDSLIEKYEK